MAKKSFFGNLVKLGGIAAVTAVAYYKREEIKGFLNDVMDRCFPQDAETEEDYIVEEPDVVIDATEKTGEETLEETPEA